MGFGATNSAASGSLTADQSLALPSNISGNTVIAIVGTYDYNGAGAHCTSISGGPAFTRVASTQGFNSGGGNTCTADCFIAPATGATPNVTVVTSGHSASSQQAVGLCVITQPIVFQSSTNNNNGHSSTNSPITITGVTTTQPNIDLVTLWASGPQFTSSSGSITGETRELFQSTGAGANAPEVQIYWENVAIAGPTGNKTLNNTFGNYAGAGWLITVGPSPNGTNLPVLAAPNRHLPPGLKLPFAALLPPFQLSSANQAPLPAHIPVQLYAGASTLMPGLLNQEMGLTLDTFAAWFGMQGTNHLLGPSGSVWGRLTGLTQTPITTSDLTALTSIYFTPYGGQTALLFDGTRDVLVPFSEIAIPVTDSSQTATTTNGSPFLTNLTDTSKLCVGMKVSGTNVAGAATISAIPNQTTVILSANCTGSATGVGITFKVPLNSCVDVFATVSYAPGPGGGNMPTLQVRQTIWASQTARAIPTDYYLGRVMNLQSIRAGDFNAIPAFSILLGTYSTTTTDGQTEDSVASRYICNVFNPVEKKFRSTSTTNFSTASTSFVQVNSVGVNIVIAVPKFVYAIGGALVDMGSGNYGVLGIGLDSAGVNTTDMTVASGFLAAGDAYAVPTYMGNPGVGKHSLILMFLASGGSSRTAAQSSGTSVPAIHLSGWMQA